LENSWKIVGKPWKTWENIGNLSSKHSKTIKNLYIVLPLDQEISEEFHRGKTAGYIYINPSLVEDQNPEPWKFQEYLEGHFQLWINFTIVIGY